MTLVQAAQVAAKQPAPNGPIKAQQSVDPGGVAKPSEGVEATADGRGRSTDRPTREP